MARMMVLELVVVEIVPKGFGARVTVVVGRSVTVDPGSCSLIPGRIAEPDVAP